MTRQNLFKLALLLGVVFVCGCNSNKLPAQTKLEEEVTKDAIYSETANYIEPSNLVITFNDGLSDDAVVTEKLTEKITKDLQPLLNSGCDLQEYSISVEEKIIKDKVEADYRNLKCTAKHIESGEYLEPLVCNYMDVNIYDAWKKYAFYAYVYQEEIDKEYVKEYLSDENNQDVLSMFTGHFSPYYRNAIEIKGASNVAKAYGNYIIEKYGIDEFWKCRARDYVNEWLEDFGLGIVFDDPYAEVLDTFQYSPSEFCAVIVETDQNVEFFCEPTKVEGKDVFMFRQFLYESYIAVDNIKNIVKETVPEAYELLIKDDYNEHTKVKFNLDSYSRDGETSRKSINLKKLYVFPHEYIHSFFYRYRTTTDWVEEGIANYFLYYYSNMSSENYGAVAMQDRYLKWDIQDITEKPKYGKRSYGSFYLYAQRHGRLVSDDELNYKELTCILAQLETLSLVDGDELRSSIQHLYALEKIFIDEDNNGNKMSYEQATFFIKYLVDKYSLETVLNFYINRTPFVEAFGATFDEEFENWMDEFIDDDVLKFYEEVMR